MNRSAQRSLRLALAVEGSIFPADQQYRLIEVTSDEASWWQEFAELSASGSGALLADTPAERLAFLRSLLRHSFAELRPATPGDAS